jgi:hypothetical protein
VTRQAISEEEVETKPELTLRKQGVPLSDHAQKVVSVDLEGLWDK